MQDGMDIKARIEKLKKEKDAVILAHYYTRPEVQEAADYTGDSLYLSQMAKKAGCRVIVLAGVYFMGESAALLNPDKEVLMPDINADCAMAHMADEEIIRQLKEKYNDLKVACYINSSVELKALSDICVTSSNAVDIVKKLESKNIFFIPDKNLGRYVKKCVPEKNVILNDGFCPVHEKMDTAEIEKLKTGHPKAEVMAHPECNESVSALADYIGSTAGIIDRAAASKAREFIICTEIGIHHELEKSCPDKTFYFPKTSPVCQDMKTITLEKIEHVLMTGENRIVPDPLIAEKAKIPLLKMLEM